jgi:hypothetical protein
MIVGPADHSAFGRVFPVGAEDLVGVNPDRMTQTAVVKAFVGLFLADVFDRFALAFFERWRRLGAPAGKERKRNEEEERDS